MFVVQDHNSGWLHNCPTKFQQKKKRSGRTTGMSRRIHATAPRTWEKKYVQFEGRTQEKEGGRGGRMIQVFLIFPKTTVFSVGGEWGLRGKERGREGEEEG